MSRYYEALGRQSEAAAEQTDLIKARPGSAGVRLLRSGSTISSRLCYANAFIYSADVS